MRWRSSVNPARPYICRLIIFVLVLTPSVRPLLNGRVRTVRKIVCEAVIREARAVAPATAPTEATAAERFAEFEQAGGERYPAIIRLWRSSREQFTSFLAFPPEIRKVVYTTHAVVIWSPRRAVLHVDHEGLQGRVLPGGRGYLRLSITRISRRKHACSAGADTRLVA
jgi:hypothetical protein